MRVKPSAARMQGDQRLQVSSKKGLSLRKGSRPPGFAAA
jgi:hypothetical protein